MIYIATSPELPHLSGEEPRLIPALEALGYQVAIKAWSDPHVDWSAAELVVVRTCWDYFHHRRAFLAWAEAVEACGTTLANPAHIMRHNSSKAYLFELQGVATLAPTLCIDAQTYDRDLASQWWQAHPEAVFKPLVSASAHNTWRASWPERHSHWKRLEGLLAKGQHMLLQAYLPEVATQGEWSCIFFGGDYSHAVQKIPQKGDFRVQDEWGGSVHHVAAPAEMRTAAAAISTALTERHGPLSYARIDLVDHRGTPHLMECELIEPELFLGAQGAPGRLAKVLAGAIG